MGIQYISDSKGDVTGVFIPIEDWEELKNKYGIKSEDLEVPDWQKDIVNERMSEYKKNPGIAEDFNKAMDDIENEL